MAVRDHGGTPDNSGDLRHTGQQRLNNKLKWYFGYLAHKRGVEVQEIYDETAAGIDLRRLPEPDEIADAVVFLASPLARAITGQCLDVNCGEYHH